MNAFYPRDFMSIISEANDRFSTLLNTKIAQNEPLKGSETRLSAALPRFKSISNATKLPKCITTLMILNTTNIDHSQHLSALSAAARSGTMFNDQANNDGFYK